MTDEYVSPVYGWSWIVYFPHSGRTTRKQTKNTRGKNAEGKNAGGKNTVNARGKTRRAKSSASH